MILNGDAETQCCPDCKEDLPLANFLRNARMKDGLSFYCAVCSRARSLVSKRKRFGCAICREAPAGHVDQDHATSRVRGLFCFNCNGALGQFRDRRDLMLRAAMYLEGGPRAVVDTLPFGVGLIHGEFENPRPVDEPAPV